jgi:hypothetical protein
VAGKEESHQDKKHDRPLHQLSDETVRVQTRLHRTPHQSGKAEADSNDPDEAEARLPKNPFAAALVPVAANLE